MDEARTQTARRFRHRALTALGGAFLVGLAAYWVLADDVPDRGLERLTLTGFDSPILGLAFTPDGRTLVVANSRAEPPGKPYNGLKLFDTAGGELRVAMETEGFGILYLAVSPDGKMAATATFTDLVPAVDTWDLAGRKRAWVAG